MKVAVVGTRDLKIDNLQDYLPENVTEIVSGCARGVDKIAKEYALNNNIPFKEFSPDFKKFGEAAIYIRNLRIVAYSDLVVAFWNGISGGTKSVIDNCKKSNVPVKVIMCGDLYSHFM